MKSFALIFTSFFVLNPSTAAVFDCNYEKIPDKMAHTERVCWEPLKPSHGISGVGVLHAPWVGRVCTTVFIDTPGTEGPAYLLSNAHCFYFDHWGEDPLDTDEVRLNQNTSYWVRFPNIRRPFKIRSVRFQSENNTDLAIIELRQRKEMLRSFGLTPLPVRSPQRNEQVELVGIPLNYVPYYKMKLTVSRCKLGKTTALFHGLKIGPYFAFESVEHQCSSVPGFSGGPLIAKRKNSVGKNINAVVLLNSHGADDGSRNEPDCTYAKRPCELKTRRTIENINYGQKIEWVNACFSESGVFRQSCRPPSPDASSIHRN